MSKLPSPISFDWDKGNLDKNWKKHKVHFKKTEKVFFNRPLKIFKDPKHSETEQRYVSYGKSKKERMLTVVFTYRENKIRIISARDQHRKEKLIYETK